MSLFRSIVAIVLLGSAVSARAERPADGLMRLVPDDAGVTLAVEDLRGHAREFLELVPHARFADVSGARHMVAGDKNDQFAAAIIDFLKDL